MNKKDYKFWKNKIKRIALAIFVAVMSLLTFSLIWAKRSYGNIGVEEIIFHLNMPLKGTSQDFIISYVIKALVPAIITTILLLLFFDFFHTKRAFFLRFKIGKGKNHRLKFFPINLKKRTHILLIIAWIILLLLSANKTFGVYDYIRHQMQQSEIMVEEYKDPKKVDITFPENKRNLIWIYVESAETSSQDKQNGGLFDQNYIPEMTQIAKDNISFSQSELLEGASIAPACGWTIAGLVAQTSGLPLKLYAYDDVTGVDNSMSKYNAFMSGATTLGDILSGEGYTNYFLAGSDFEFGERQAYFSEHGKYEVWDYNTAIQKGKIDKDYYEWWGFEDQKLYSYAKEELLRISKKGEPFNYSLLTVDTHHEDGYVCPLCNNAYDSQYANVWNCASRQVADFVSWVQQQDFYENTTIVITGDHCSMDSDFYGDIKSDKHHGGGVRKVYNAFINSPIEPLKETNRKFTTMDFFPTVLGSLNVKIEGDRLGLGTNLFGEKQTLSEQYGYEKLFDDLNKNSKFYNENIMFPKKAK